MILFNLHFYIYTPKKNKLHVYISTKVLHGRISNSISNELTLLLLRQKLTHPPTPFKVTVRCIARVYVR